MSTSYAGIGPVVAELLRIRVVKDYATALQKTIFVVRFWFSERREEVLKLTNVKIRYSEQLKY